MTGTVRFKELSGFRLQESLRMMARLLAIMSVRRKTHKLELYVQNPG